MRNHFRITLLAVFAIFQLGQTSTPSISPAKTPAPKPGPAGLIISRETTRFLGPQRTDGTVDYATAINDDFLNGATAKNNAAVIFLKITGTEFIGKSRATLLRVLRLDTSLQYPGTWRGWLGFHPGKTDSNEERRRFKNYEVTPWTPADCPEIDAWIKSQDQTLKLTLEACRRDHFWFPVITQTATPTLSGRLGVNMPERVDELLLLRASERIGTGDDKNALVDLQAAHKLAWLLGQAPGLNYVRWATEIQGCSCHGYLNLISARRQTPEALGKIMTELQDHGALPTFAQAIDRCDRYEYADDVQLLAKVDTAHWMREFNLRAGPDLDAKIAAALKKRNLPRLDFNRMLRSANEYYDDFLKDTGPLKYNDRVAREIHLSQLEGTVTGAGNLRNDYALAHRTEPEDSWPYPQPGETVETYTDRVGMALLATYVDDGRLTRPPMFNDTKCLHQATLAALALELYHDKNEHFPPALKALIPDYLKEEPQPPIDRHIKYAVTEKGCTFSWLNTDRNSQSNAPPVVLIFELKN